MSKSVNQVKKDMKHEEVTRELRVQSRELREIRKTLKLMLELMQAQEKDRLGGDDLVIPVYHRAHPDYDGPQPGDVIYEAIPDVIIEDNFVDIRDMGVTQ